jgi:hypothetical protein
MADRFLTRIAKLGEPVDKAGLVVSNGSRDAGRLISTDGSGKIDPTLLYPSGGGGLDYTLTANASVALSGHRAVKALTDGTLAYVDNATSGDIGLCVGITITAASSGASINYQANGPIIYGGWSWVEGPIFVGLNGQLTQTPPTSGFIQRVATALSATSLILSIGQAIALA